jgi:hypothetical protein
LSAPEKFRFMSFCYLNSAPFVRVTFFWRENKLLSSLRVSQFCHAWGGLGKVCFGKMLRHRGKLGSNFQKKFISANPGRVRNILDIFCR